ncbi:MAG: ABC transporter substrate-binding protein, partial [Brachybacterium sp.]|nr:ABC transporter substrate-binding protein [Brachybacterium sp.]
SGDQSLVVGVTTDIDTLFPWTATQFQAIDVLSQIYGTLTEFDDELEVVPGIAEDWEVSEDGLTYTFTLREGIVFSDGSELTAEDVVFSFTSIMDEETAAVSATNLSAVDEVTAVDERTVGMTLTAADAALPSKLASTTMAILPADADLETLKGEPVGTGAFVLESRTPNESLTLSANPDYWGGEPELATVEFRVIPDQSAIVAALQAGSVQFAVFDDQLVAETIGGDVTVTETPQLSYHVLQINPAASPLDDVNVRLAIACGIDRQEVLDTAAMGAGEVTGPITSPAYRSDPDARPCPTRDVEAAKQHLADAGHGDGLTLTAIVMQDGYSTAVAEAENIQSQLKEVGITLKIESLESGSYVDRWVAADFELAVALNGGAPDPDAMYGRYFTSDGNLNAVAGYSSDTLDELFADGKATIDPEERKPIYDEISRELEDNAAWVWLFTAYTYTAMTEGVDGFEPAPNGSIKNIRNITLA